MPRRLIYSRKSLSDLDAIERWLTQPGSGRVARRKLNDIWSAIERLRHAPCLHPAVFAPGVRELPCAGGYRALYRVTPDTGRDDTAGDVRVLRVFGPGQSRDRL